MRLIKAYNLAEGDIYELEKLMTSSNVKAILIAAGLGSRLKGYTEDLPKCMLKFGEKTTDLCLFSSRRVTELQLLFVYTHNLAKISAA